MARRSKVHPAAKVPLSESEKVQAKLLSRWAIRLAIRQEAAALLENGCDPDHLADLRVSTTTSLCGHAEAMKRWGVSSAEACRLAQKRVRDAGLVDSALWLAILYDTGTTAPPPTYLGTGSGWVDVPGAGLAWSPGSGVDPTIRVQRWPDPEQMVLWDLDATPWTYWSAMREEDALSGPG